MVMNAADVNLNLSAMGREECIDVESLASAYLGAKKSNTEEECW